jgi:hypothetical protein
MPSLTASLSIVARGLKGRQDSRARRRCPYNPAGAFDT